MGDHLDDYRRLHHERHRRILDLLSRYVPEKQRRCLDVGGGEDAAGIVAEIKEKYADEFHTVELNANEKKLREKDIEAETCNVDLEPLPYDDGHFDIAIMASLIEHLYNPRRVISEITRVLKPGGLLILETPNAVALGRRLDALLGRNPFSRFNQYNALENKAIMEYCSVFYTPEEVSALLNGAFAVEEVSYCMHNPPVNIIKKTIRQTACALNKRLSDCFFVVARRK